MILNNHTLNKPVLGIFLSGKSLLIGKVFNNNIEKSFSKKIKNKESEENILKELIAGIDEVIDNEVNGIGIGVPSLVDVKKGIVYRVQNIPSWREVHLKDILEERFGVQVHVNNDANCFAIGEKYFGKALKYNNIVGLIIGTGMGAGIITNGQLYSGRNCGAGEFGSIPYHDFDYEYYCSVNFFEEKYGLRTEALIERAKQNDKIALAIFEQYGQHIGNAIKTILFSVDPDIIILGGSISKAFNFFKEAMFKEIKSFPYSNTIKNLKVEISETENISILGAAALFINAQILR